MAVHHMNKHQPKPTFWQNVGNKFKTAAHVAGTVKGVIDAGRTIDAGASTVEPYIAPIIAGLI